MRVLCCKFIQWRANPKSNGEGHENQWCEIFDGMFTQMIFCDNTLIIETLEFLPKPRCPWEALSLLIGWSVENAAFIFTNKSLDIENMFCRMNFCEHVLTSLLVNFLRAFWYFAWWLNYVSGIWPRGYHIGDCWHDDLQQKLVAYPLHHVSLVFTSLNYVSCARRSFICLLEV